MNYGEFIRQKEQYANFVQPRRYAYVCESTMRPVEMSRERIHGDAPLFAQMEVTT